MRINNKKTASATLLFALAAPMPLFAAAAPAKETSMPTVVVKDKAQTQSQGYQSGITTIGKIPQAAKDVPQSLTTVTGALIEERNADSLKDALRNVAGLTFNAGEGGRIGDNITIRGFGASSDLYLDGMRDNAQYNRDLFNLDRVEVLRGASSMIFGRGSTGGIVNQASKEPSLTNRSRLSAAGGTHDYHRLTADVNQKIASDAAIRLNLMQTSTDSMRNVVEKDSYGFAPSVRWGIGSPDEFQLSYYHLEYSDIPDYGIPILPIDSGKPLHVPFDTFYGMALADYQKDTSQVYTARWTHTFDAGQQLRSTLRKHDVGRDLRAVAPRINEAATTVTRGRQARGAEEDNFTAQSDFLSKFEAFGMKHDSVVGAEYTYETSYRWSYFSSGPTNNPATTPFGPNPYDPLPAGYEDTYARINPLDFTARNLGIYAQDIVEFVPHWKLLAGARFDNFKAEYLSFVTSTGIATSYDRDDQVPSWRTGLMYQPTDYVTYYVAYGSAFNPSGDVYSVEASQPARSAKTDPEKSVNYEIGAKWELMDGNLSLRTALFRTEKTNERNTDPAIPDIYLLSGKRHTDGVELEAAGRVTKKWELFGAVALMRAEIDKQLNPFAVGLRPPNTPDYSGSVWTTYRLFPEWKVGGGVDFVGPRTGYSIGATTPYTAPVIRHVPGYARFDAMIEWEQETYAVRLNLFNILNQRYYDAMYPNGAHAIPGIDRQAQLTLSYKF